MSDVCGDVDEKIVYMYILKCANDQLSALLSVGTVLHFVFFLQCLRYSKLLFNEVKVNLLCYITLRVSDIFKEEGYHERWAYRDVLLN